MINELIELLKQFDVSETILLGLTVLTFAVTFITGIIKLIHWAILKNNQWLLNESLKPYFSPNDVDRATRYYIPTKFQNVSPTADDEPGKSHLASAKQELMPMFLEKAFTDHGDNTKYYLILADSGMGKTTFMVNLFLDYTVRPFKNLFGINANQIMKLFPLGSPDIWKDIEKIENKPETILLLDAFDEDIKAVDDYGARMKEILEATKEFKEIVITCRSQFFPSDRELPNDTGYTTFGGEQESYKFQRIYLSVFDDKDIKKYLKKRFSIFHGGKRKRAYEIVKKSPSLMMRPMLLSYINDLVEANRIFEHSYEIYEVLIEKWIERESKKYGIRKKYGSEEKYRELLLNFSQSLALNLYEKREEKGGYFITKNDFIKGSENFQIDDLDSYEISETEIRSKSLLNRDAEGRYKFSHKSILEYFLAKELIQNGNLLSRFNFEGMSVTAKFLDEMTETFRRLGGIFEFTNGYGQRSLPLKKMSIDKLSVTNKVKIGELGKFNIQNLAVFVNLQELIIFDDKQYYLLYIAYCYHLVSNEKWRDRIELKKRLELRELLALLAQHQMQELKAVLQLQELQQRLKGLELKELLELLELVDLPELAELRELRDRRERRELRELSGRRGLRRSLPNIEDFLRNMRLLKEKLPNCKIIY